MPAPSRAPGLYSFAILLLADREPLETLSAQIGALSSQNYARWTLHVIGSDPARRRITERAAASDPRIKVAEMLQREGAAEAERRVALSSGRIGSCCSRSGRCCILARSNGSRASRQTPRPPP